jgi:hypothetical protein
VVGRLGLSLLAGVVLLFSASTAFARATEAQRNWGTGTGSAAPTWRIAVTAGRLLIAGVTFDGGSNTTVTPPAGWTPIGTTYRSDNGTTIGMAVYYIANCSAKTAGTAETFTFSPATAVGTVQLTEVAGIVTTSPVDTDSIATATGTGTSITLTAGVAADETSEYGYSLIASTAQSANFGQGTNGFTKTNSYRAGVQSTNGNLDGATAHRSSMYSTLMTSAAGSALSTRMTLPNAAYTGVMVAFKVQALYWIGAGSYPARPVNPSPPVAGVCYGYFDDDACWANSSGGTWGGTASPAGNDVVVFDSGGLGDCTMNPWTPGTEQAYSIEVRSGYLGAISKTANDLQLQRHFTLMGGTFNGAAGLNFQTNQGGTYAGDLDVAAGTLNGNGMNFYVRTLYVEGGTFSTGTGSFTTNGGVTNIAGGTTSIGGAYSSGAVTMTAGAVTFGSSVTTSGAITMTGGSITGGPAAFSVTGSVVLTSSSLTTGAGSFSTTGSLTLNTSSTANLAAATSMSVTSNVSVLTGSTLTLGSGASSIGGTITVRGTGSTASAGSVSLTIGSTAVVDQAAVFNANSATINFTGAFTVGSSGGAASTLNANTATLNFNNAAAAGANSFLIYSPSALNGGTANLNFGTNSASTSRAFRMTGGTADLSTANVTFNGLGDFYPTGGTITFGASNLTFPGTATLNNAATTCIITGGTGSLTFSGTVTTSGCAVTAGSGAVTFNGTYVNSSGSFNLASASAVAFNAAATVSGGTTTLGSQTVGMTSLNVSSGTFNAGTAAVSLSGAFSSAGTSNFSTATSLSVGGSTTVSNGTTTLNGTTSLAALTVSGGTLTGTPALTVGGAFWSLGTTNLASASSLTFSSSFTVGGGTTTFGSQTVSLPSLAVSAGTFNAGTAVVTVVGLTSSTGGSTSFASTTSGPTFMGNVSIGGGTVTLGSGTVAMQGLLTFTGGALGAGSSNLTITGPVSATNGSFNCNTATIVINGAVTFAGTLPSVNSTFNGNTANVTFKGPVAVGGADGSRGIMHANGATFNFEYPTTVMSPNSLLLQGSSIALFDVATTAPYATLNFGRNTIAGTNAINLSAGSLTINSATTTTFYDLGEVVIANGTTLTTGSNAVTFPNTVTHNGTLTASSGALTFSQAHTIAGTLTGSTGAITFSQPLTVSGTFSGSSGARTFSSTVAVSGTFTASTGTHTFGGAVTNSAGTFNLTNAASPLTLGFGLTVSGGATTIGGQASSSISTLTMSSGTFAVGNSVLTITGDTNITGGVASLSNTSRTVTFGGNLNVGPGTLTAGLGAAGNNKPVVVTGVTTVTANGIINAGTATNTFRCNGAVVLGTMGGGSPGTFNGDTSTTLFSSSVTVQGGSTLNVGAATLMTFSSTLSLLGSSTFNGGTGSTTFALAPTLTSGTFNVGTSGTTGRHTFQQSTTFSSGVTLAFPAIGGRVSLSATRVLTLQGPVTAASSGGTVPRIDCNGCTATQGITVAFASSSTLNISGLEFYNSVSTGVSIASGATWTLFKNVKFQTTAATGGAGTHLAITLGTQTVQVPGAYFDTTTTTNVTLNGTAGQVRGARAIFEFQSTTTNGTGAGEARDVDGDNSPGDANPANNYGENVSAPYYGSVVQWSAASPTDITGTAEGFPTAAFDWNTFAYYGVYVGFKNIGGASTADRIWLRNTDGTAGYYFDVPDSSGDIIGSPYWETSNEVTMGLDVNGDGDSTDTSVHVVYVPTSGGHIIKLIDNGSSLARPASGVWSTDFTDSNVASISSPLISDSTNLYFGGADSTTTKIFGVQVAAGGSEKTLVKNIGSVGAVTAAMAWKRITGVVYLYVGSRASLGQAYIYRINVSPGAVVEASYAGVTSNVNGSVRLANNRAYAVTDGGQVHAIDATNFGVGGFVNVTGFPYQTAAAVPIQMPAMLYAQTGLAYFGDNSGRLYSVTSAGANETNYPLSVTASAITSSPLYIAGSGVIAMGAADGYVYFIDRHNASGSPVLFNRYYVGAGSVSSVSYNASNSQYMVASSDGKIAFVQASAVPDPTIANE